MPIAVVIAVAFLAVVMVEVVVMNVLGMEFLCSGCGVGLLV